jgi:alpha-methylacyl-CoA racemase
MKERLEAIFKTKTRDEWCELLESDPELCFAPVLSMAEAYQHPHNQARQTFVEVAGIVQPAPAPRFSRTPGEISSPPAHAGQHTDEALADWGFTADEITKLKEAGAVR